MQTSLEFVFLLLAMQTHSFVVTVTLVIVSLIAFKRLEEVPEF